MSKKIIILALAISLILTLVGCNKEKTSPQNTQKNEIVETSVPVVSETNTYLDNYINVNKRPFAVMIDNDDNNSRPQAGIDEAYLVYEMPVEGGATRFMALFRNVQTEKIGPVRSARHYFLDFAKENDAIYTHFGWSPRAITDISKLSVNNINGINTPDSDIFWRERKYQGDWHSAYTSALKIEEFAVKKGYNTETENKNAIKYSSESITLPENNAATEIVLSYSGMYSTSYKYNKEAGIYEKQINNEPHKMQNGNVLSFKNIIVQFIADGPLGDGTARREIITTGRGKGYYFTNGAYEEIIWEKASRTSPTIYKKADGSELYINAGNTIINIISPYSDFIIR